MHPEQEISVYPRGSLAILSSGQKANWGFPGGPLGRGDSPAVTPSERHLFHDPARRSPTLFSRGTKIMGPAPFLMSGVGESPLRLPQNVDRGSANWANPRNGTLQLDRVQ